MRQSWYSLLSSVVQVPEVNEKYASKLCALTLGSLAESEPLVASPIWEAALSVATAIPDCWKHVDARKGVLPQLWKVLKNGGFGSAVHIYPSLLPFLSLIPPEVMGDTTEFYRTFFDAFREGMLSSRVQGSVAECNAIIQAFMECVRYVVTQHLESDDHSAAIRKLVLLEQVRSKTSAQFSLTCSNSSIVIWVSHSTTVLRGFVVRLLGEVMLLLPSVLWRQTV